MLRKVLKSLFKKPTEPPWNKPLQRIKENDEKDDELIEVIDQSGRQYQVTRKEVRTSILPDNIQKNWNNPERLARVIIRAMEDDLFSELLEASERLLAITQDLEDAICMRGFILTKCDQAAEAEQLFLHYLKKYPKTGIILTGLARAQYQLQKKAKAIATLEKGLKQDPNQENGLDWWVNVQCEKLQQQGMKKEAAYQRTLEIAHKKFSGWRVKLLMGILFVQQKNRELALEWFNQVLNDQWSADALTQMSSVLGNHGFRIDVLNIVAPHYIPEKHELLMGLNLLHIYLELKRLKEGDELLKKLFALQKPAIEKKLLWYEGQFNDLAAEQYAISNEEATIDWSIMDSPLCCHGWGERKTGFEQTQSNKKIAIFQFSWELDKTVDPTIPQYIDGRLARAIPLYLTERIYHHPDKTAVFLYPYASNGYPILYSTGIEKHTIKALIPEDVCGVLTGKVINQRLVLHYWDFENNQEENFIIKLNAENPEKMIPQIEEFLSHAANINFLDDTHNFINKFDHIPAQSLGSYLFHIAGHLNSYLRMSAIDAPKRSFAEHNMLRLSLDMALYTATIQTQLNLLSIIQIYMRYKSTSLKNYEHFLSPWLEENIDTSTMIKPLFIETYISYRKFCEKKVEAR